MARQKSISIPITGNNAPLRKALKESQKDLTAFGKAQTQWAKASSLAYGAAGTAVAKFALDSVKAALEDQKSQALLARQLTATTGATRTQIGAVEDYITKTQLATNITDDQLRPALAQLVRVTGSTASAQKLLSTAIDTSIGSGRDLGSIVSALSRAYNGNYGALQKLGIVIDKNKTDTEGFSAVTDQLTAQFGGSAKAATETMAGKMENLNIRWQEFKETLGVELMPVLEDTIGKLSAMLDLVQSLVNADWGKLDNALGNLGKGLLKSVGQQTGILPIIRWGWGKIRDNVHDARTETEKATDATKGLKDGTDEAADASEKLAKAQRMVGYMKDDYQQLSDILVKQAEDFKKAQAEQSQAAAKTTADNKKLKQTYQETAKTLREELGKALEDSKKQLQEAKDAAQAFGDSFAYSFGVSLAGAYSDANDAEQTYTDALKARKDAYDALDLAKQGTDLDAYLKALQDVQKAEQGVTEAQKARVTPAAAFATQIANAKTFGANLKTLIGDPYKLGQAGLQQLLDLGPTAGAQVTSDLINGTAGFTVSDLNTSLADLAGVQAGLSAGITGALGGQYNAATMAAQAQVDALSSASIGAPGVGQGFTIVVNTGVGDPVAIGAAVKGVLTQYDQRAGKLTVQGPKKKAKSR